MTDVAVQAQVRAGLELARKHLYAQWKAERSCELYDRPYKRYDGRGFHSVTLEAGRMYAYAELLGDIDLDFAELKQQAREDATACWRDETFKDFLPPIDAEAA